MRSIKRDIHLQLPAEAVFDLLLRPSAIRGWWSASRVIVAPRLNGLWIATWGDDEDSPDFITAARLTAFDPPKSLRFSQFEYTVGSGKPPSFTNQLEIEFTIVPAEIGSILHVHQWGFPDEPSADAFFNSCIQGWSNTFDGIERYVAHA